jgi:hypothetical protein
MADGIGHITAAYSRNLVCHLTLDCMLFTNLSEKFIIAQKIRSSPMLFLDPVAKYFSTYVRKLLPNLYTPHLPYVSPMFCQATALFL